MVVAFRKYRSCFVEQFEQRLLFSWSSYIGGGGDEYDKTDVATDTAGNVYVVGQTSAGGWAAGGLDTSFNGGTDAFVAKFTADGQPIWSTYLGGIHAEWATAVSIDGSGNVYIAGYSDSYDWIPSTPANNDLMFLAKLTPGGQEIWKTRVAMSELADMAVDSNGNAYLVGIATSDGLAQDGWDTSYNGELDGFVVKYSSSGVRQWSSYLGSVGYEDATSVAVGADGRVVIGGATSSFQNAWVSGGADTDIPDSTSGYVVVLSSSGQHVWSSYVETSTFETIDKLMLSTDPANNVFVAATAKSFLSPYPELYTTKFSANGTSMAWPVAAMGFREEGNFESPSLSGVVSDKAGNAYLSLRTASRTSATGGKDTDFGNTDPSQFTHDALVVKLDTQGKQVFSTYAGGTDNEWSGGIAVSQGGLVYVVGFTESSGWITGGADTTLGGFYDAFLAQVNELPGQGELQHLFTQQNIGPDNFFDLTQTADGKIIVLATGGGVATMKRDTATGLLTFADQDATDVDAVRGVAISPDNKFVYASETFQNAVYVFSLDPATGQMFRVEKIDDVQNMTQPHGMTVSPDGKNVYVSGQESSSITVFTRNATTGRLTYHSQVRDGAGGVDGLNSVRTTLVSPDGKTLYAIGENGEGAVFSRNTSTGALTLAQTLKNGVGGISGLGFGNAIALSPDGKHVYFNSGLIGGIVLFERNTTTGLLTFKKVAAQNNTAGVQGLDNIRAVRISPDGANLYTAGQEGGAAMFLRNSSTGDLTFIGAHRNGTDVNAVPVGLEEGSAMIVSPDGLHVYVSSRAPDNAVVGFKRQKSSATSSIAGNVFNDPNSNGTRDGGETNLSGWELYLDANNNGAKDPGETIATTNASGGFSFNNLALGTHRVRHVLKPGYRKTLPNAFAGYDIAVSGQTVGGVNFGFTTNIRLAGTIFNDGNSNGVRDAGEAAIAGVTVNVVSNNTIVATRITDENGFWQVKGLSAGTGEARVVLPTGYTATQPNNAKYAGSMSSGQQNGNLNFGLKLSATPTPVMTPPAVKILHLEKIDPLASGLV